jgi:putative exosortase-associated protein (TIGR04073 family)
LSGIAVVAACVGASAAWAELPPPPAQDRVDEVMGRYNLHPAFNKLGRGVANALGGWLEIPLNIGQRMSSSDTGGSFFTGVAYGLFKGIVRTGVGVYETATFFLPYPEDFAPILPTLAYFQKQGRRQSLPFE